MGGNVLHWIEGSSTPADADRGWVGACFSSLDGPGNFAGYPDPLSSQPYRTTGYDTNPPYFAIGSGRPDTSYDNPQIGFRVASIPSLTWTASGGGAWNTTGSNTPWSDGKNPAAYSDPGLATTGSFTFPCCFVTFPQLSHGTIAVSVQSSGVSPPSLTFSNTSGTYRLSGGPIQGPTSLVLSGDGTLILAESNTYTGGTDVEDGRLILASKAALERGSSLTIGAGAGSIFAPAETAAPQSSAVVAPVPEPGTLLLLGVGALGLLAYASRKRLSSA
jgi:autotransporter-associated beta strand protein